MGKAKSQSVKRAISLPADMDRRIRKHPDVNWSEVAQLAFDAKLKELAPKPKDNKMQGLENLAKLIADDSSEMSQEGKTAGRDWAKGLKTAADVRGLRRLAKFMDGPNADDLFEENETGAYSVAERLATVILGGDPDRQASVEFWECALGDEVDELTANCEFLQGFAEGAVDAFILAQQL